MERQAVAKAQKSAPRSKPLQRQSAGPSSAGHPLLELQRSIGNQAVQRLIRSPYIQTKLQVSTPGDPFEREADRVADTVMRMTKPEVEATEEETPQIQAKPLATQITPLVQRESEQPLEEEKEEAVATKPVVQGVPLAVREDADEEKVAPKLDTNLSLQEEQKEKKGLDLQTKLKVNEPGDIYEQEADRIADQVMAAPAHNAVSGASPRIQRLADQPTGQADAAPASVDHALATPGRPLEPALRQDMEQRFGYDFSRVRVHSGAAAEQSAQDVNARAYTVGHNMVFGHGRFAPGTNQGQRLVAHELTHVVQQRQGACPELQRSRLLDYNDRDVMHDPSKLTDAQIEATNEFKAYTDSKLPWQWEHHMTREEALLACRLILRRLREGETVTWERDAADFMNRARKQLGTLREAERLVGKLAWVGASWTQFDEPATAESDFTRWLLAAGPEPTDVSKMNCWEMILFGAFRGRIVTKAWVQSIYKNAQTAARTSRDPDAPAIELENELCGISSSVTFRPMDPRSPEPLPGDIIIFNVIEKHAAISFGTKAIGGDHWVISLHASPAASHSQVEITTLEQLLTDTGLTTAKLCRAPWRGRGRP